MLLSLLLAPAFSFHFFAVIIVAIAAVFVVVWFLQKKPIPEPFNIVVYAVLALLALWFLFWILRQV